ncbi:hypothetical protein PTKIN_Ptkin05aG0126000 [Pterospermum kingtungense]
MPSSFVEEQSQSEKATSFEIEGSIGGQHVEDEEANTADSTRAKKKTRGPTRGLRIIGLEKGEKLLVKFDKDSHVVEDWKFLVNLRSEATYKDKSNKAKTSRGKRSMPAYSGAKSYARLRNQIEEKTGNERSCPEAFIESRKRKKDKEVDPLT